MVRCWTSRLDSWMPWFSLSNASVCFSVTCFSSLPNIVDRFSALSSNGSRTDHVTFIIGYPLEGAP
jgi:hypothetical protein